MSTVELENRMSAAKRKELNYQPLPFSQSAICNLIRRVMGENYADAFIIKKIDGICGMDSFILSDSAEGKIELQATSGVAAGAAVRWYLQERCSSYIGPISRRMNLPTNPPKIGTTYKNESPFLYRYFFNYCTFGYTCAFWKWEDWEPFLDWLLLSGYNLILNPLGNERVWTSTLQRLGYSLDNAREFLCSPVFYPWQCMLNLTGWGGAAPEYWYDEQVELSKKITCRLNEMGANVVLPGYSGIVPDDFKKYYPEAKLLEQGDWCDFHRPSLISYEDSLFSTVAKIYYEEQENVLGDCSAYFSVDPFHEGGDASSVDMAQYGNCCYDAMKCRHKSAVWVLQGWSTNPNRQMLSALEPANVLIANLKSEINVDGGDDFANRPWMYGCVNNFGGRRVPRANLNSQLLGPHQAATKQEYTMVGIGMLPEGVEVDECAFDIFSDIMFRRESPSAKEWQTDYIKHRYGYQCEELEKAWSLLRDRVYLSDTASTPKESALCARPSLTVSMITPACETSDFTYHPKELIPIIRGFLKKKETLVQSVQYRLDLSELIRQIIALTAWLPVKKLQDGFRKRNKKVFDEAVVELMKLFDYQCEVMADSPARSLDENLERAMRFGKSKEDKEYFAYQLKLLITSWGDRNASKILHDYACREWSGMLEMFYKPRWEKYIQYLNTNFDTDKSEAEIDESYPHFDLEQDFCKRYDGKKERIIVQKDFSYAEKVIMFCEKLLNEEQITVTFQKSTNAMELK